MAKLIDISRQVAKQQVIFNNVQQEVLKRYIVGACPDCKTPLFSQDYNGTLKDYYDSLKDVQFNIKHCPNCGVSLELPCIIDSEVEVNGEE